MQVNLSQVKAKVGEILARCGQQDVEKTCKWFLLWHNRFVFCISLFVCLLHCLQVVPSVAQQVTFILPVSSWHKELQKRAMRPEIPRLERIVRTFINLQLFPQIPFFRLAARVFHLRKGKNLDLTFARGPVRKVGLVEHGRLGTWVRSDMIK